MREREEEVRIINKGMHQVNEIYKVRQIDSNDSHSIKEVVEVESNP